MRQTHPYPPFSTMPHLSMIHCCSKKERAASTRIGAIHISLLGDELLDETYITSLRSILQIALDDSCACSFGRLRTSFEHLRHL